MENYNTTITKLGNAIYNSSVVKQMVRQSFIIIYNIKNMIF